MPHRQPLRTPMMLVALVALVSACADQPLGPRPSSAAFNVSPDASQGAQVYRGVDVYPYEGLVEVPCARDGQGDLLQLNGEVTFRWHFAVLPNGGFVQGDIAVVAQGTAVSLIDGTVYRAPLTNRVTDNYVADGNVGSNTLRIRFVGPGPGNNLSVESTAAWSVGPDGLRVFFNKYSGSCGTDGNNVPGSNEGANPIHDWPTE